MLFHELKNSDDTRVAKKVLEEQERIKTENGWVHQISDILNELLITDGFEKVKVMTRSEWKTRIRNAVDELLNVRINKCEKTKSRFLTNWERKSYVNKLSTKEAKCIMETRLNMLPIGGHFKGTYKAECDKCERSKKLSTEHIFECEKGENINELTIDNIKDGNNIQKLVKVYRHVKKFLNL